MVQIFDEIVISSGSVKGIALLGALYEFSKNYPINKIKYYTGCSIGAIICLFLNIGYSIKDITEILLKIDFASFQEMKIINFIEKCGLDEGIKFTNFLKATIINKGYNPDITFLELYNITGKILTIAVTNITKGLMEYHNYQNTPNQHILLSTRMSSNIPILFSPIFYKNSYYVDGALLDPFPYFYHKNTRKFGMWIFEKYEINFIRHHDVYFINNISDSFDYMKQLLKILYINYIKKYYKKVSKEKNVIYIDFDYQGLKVESFDILLEDRVKILNIGKHKAISFFKKLHKKTRKRYLLRKYFRLWKYNIYITGAALSGAASIVPSILPK